MLNDLFKIPLLGPLLRSRWSWRLARLAALACLVLMAAYGWHHHGIPGVKTPDPLMYTNLATYLFWVIWMMAVVFVALLFGRGWCSVCPLGWINALAARCGLRRPLPGWLDNFGAVTLTLVALQLAVYFGALHRYPDYTARLLALMLLLAVAAGLVFRGRAFCGLLCPAGAVFGLYARLAPMRLEPSEAAVCAGCEEQPCIAGGSLWKRFSLGRAVLYWRGERPDCHAGLQPEGFGGNPRCTLCLTCAQECDKGNVRFGRRAWLGELEPLGRSETLFFVVLLGLLTANFSKVYVDLRELIFWLPEQGALLLGWQEGGFYLLATLWVALALPLLLLLPGLLLLKLGGLRSETLPGSETPQAPERVPHEGEGWLKSAGRLALPCLPVVLAAHLVLAVVKLNAKLGYFPFVLEDPTGVRSYLAMNVMHTVTQPGVLLPLDLLKWIALGLLLAGLAVSALVARRLARGAGHPTLFPAALVSAALCGGLYLATVIRWLFIR